MAHPENPFPATPVTTFGVPSKTPAKLKYMRDARKLLVDYLKAGPDKGVTIALRGAHGGGKTFLLSWLAEQAAGIASASCRIIYAKADSPSFIDLYQQMMVRITRDDLVNVTREALRLEAERTTGLAKATKATSQDIHEGDLDTAYVSRAVDPNELNLWLRRTLEGASLSPDVGRRVAAAVGLIEDSTWGEVAFEWLSGRAVPLPSESLRAPLFEAGGANPDEGVVAVLEVLAALFRLAATPLVILVDQLENLVPVEGGAQTSSILKKLLEHLSLQGAMFVLAGTPPAWRRLPRDVRPRLAKRLTVGNLSAVEARNLLKAYLRDIPISDKRAEMIFTVAGGNPREILQTAYHVFEETGGKFRRANENLIREAAARAGTLADREQAAMEILDQVASDESIKVYHPAWQEAAELDRVAIAAGGGSLAIIFAVSSDRQAEAELGLRLTRLKRELTGEPGAPEMLVVAIGYSSDRVRSLLSDIARVLPFSEADFADTLKAEFAKLAHPPVAVTAQAQSAVDEALLQRLAKLETLLSDLQQTRADSDEETAQRFSVLTDASAAPERHRAEIRTRLELREGLDELSGARADRNIATERAVLRGLLVANEANVGNESFDMLGTIYLDALDAAQLAISRLRSMSSGADETEGLRTLDQLQAFRGDLTRMLRQALSPNTSRTVDRMELRVACAAVSGLLGAWISNGAAQLFLAEFRYLSRGDFLVWVWLSTLAGFALFAAIGYAIIEYFRRPQHRYISMSRYLDRLRARQERHWPTQRSG